VHACTDKDADPGYGSLTHTRRRMHIPLRIRRIPLSSIHDRRQPFPQNYDKGTTCPLKRKTRGKGSTDYLNKGTSLFWKKMRLKWNSCRDAESTIIGTMITRLLPDLCIPYFAASVFHPSFPSFSALFLSGRFIHAKCLS
jgi:hypothetical protein